MTSSLSTPHHRPAGSGVPPNLDMRELHYYWQVCQTLRTAEQTGEADDVEDARMELEGIAANTDSPRLRTLCLKVLTDSAACAVRSLKC